MHKKLTVVDFFEADRSLVRISSGNRASNKVSRKIRQMAQWLNPKNWFSSLANIEITLEEFACKKSLPEEKVAVHHDDK